jgi:hypothetical protein
VRQAELSAVPYEGGLHAKPLPGMRGVWIMKAPPIATLHGCASAPRTLNTCNLPPTGCAPGRGCEATPQFGAAQGSQAMVGPDLVFRS